MRILVINAGSSSIKYQLFNMKSRERLARGMAEGIGENKGRLTHTVHPERTSPCTQSMQGRIRDHREGLSIIVRWLAGPEAGGPLGRRPRRAGGDGSPPDIDAVGHRVVHGGASFHAPARVDDWVIEAIRETIPLAPLHNPANLTGIEVAREMFPSAVQVAVFDTAFHHTLPERAFLYGIPFDLYQEHGVRKYGFHGSSHAYVAKAGAAYLRKPLDALRTISVHLGNGSSVTAIRDGVSVDTSMGMTPLEGLVMGTRPGDLDPGLLFYLARTLNMSMDAIEQLIHHESGLKGLCGTNDVREIVEREEKGDLRAKTALEVYGYRVKKYIGAYTAVLEGLDLLIFTGGIGTHSPDIRRRACEGLESFGVVLDRDKNAAEGEGIRDIGAAASGTKILVIPTDEELYIAQETLKVISG